MRINELDEELRKAGKLKPCPICSCEFPNVGCEVFINDLGEYECESVRVKCPVCGCTIEHKKHDIDFDFLSEELESVVKAWNNRTKPPKSKKIAPNKLPF